jgi:acyl phosphate:glycerol-3-phosphate acyltransferase
MAWLQLGLLVVGAYLLGGIPGGLLIGMAMGRDLLQFGSGKTGATNTLRTLGLPAGVAVFVFDVAKGGLAVSIARFLAWPDEAWLGMAVGSAGAAAIIGHNRSVWVRLLAGRWGGGRGILTAVGAMLVVDPLVVLVAAACAGVALLVSRFVVVGAVVGALGGLATAIILVFLQQINPWFLPGVAAWALLVIAGFQDSIYRLQKGTERRLGT